MLWELVATEQTMSPKSGVGCCDDFKIQPESRACAGASSTEEVGGGAAGKGLADAAVTGLYTGLKFTGLAVRVASGLAASISKDAERAMASMEEQRRVQVRWGLGCSWLQKLRSERADGLDGGAAPGAGALGLRIFMVSGHRV